VVVEEADHHQAVMETIEGKETEMENQETILGATRLRRWNLCHMELEKIDKQSPIKQWKTTFYNWCRSHSEMD
jgi:hypothetical protein